MARVILPHADWRERAGLDHLVRVLGAEAGEARYVGGAVRDTLLGIAVSDIDIATTHAPDTVLARLRDAGIRAVPTGIAHGTITAVLDGGPVEVTTLRHDVATDGRHATVAFTDDWQADAARRDFTMNALYADPISGEVFDYFGGAADLADGHVRFIGDPLRRIAEDHLRILRFFRFLARFGDVPEPAGLAACIDRANDLMALSRERIADELLKLLLAPRAAATLALMVDNGILTPVLPEIGRDGVGRLARLVEREAVAAIPPNRIRRLAALIPPTSADAVGARLKLSNADRKRLLSAVDASGTGSPRALAYRIGTEGAIDRLLLSGEDEAAAGAAHLTDWVRPTLPIGGGALVAMGLRKGPDVARTLRVIEDQWIAEGFPAEDRVSALADAAVDQALRAAISR